MSRLIGSILLAFSASFLGGAEFHVSPQGNDSHPGSREKPFKTIQRAANQALPGDIITVHEGVYRETVNPPRGGESDEKRIVYRSAPGEKVEIKGSEIVTNWTKVQNDTWKATLPNSFFGDFNPFATPIQGDWFNAKKRVHHVGAVYLDGRWLAEASELEDVLQPFGAVNSLPSKDKATALDCGLWFAEVGESETIIWAQFKNIDPNKHLTEVNVRRSVFYPDEPGRNFITVQGFIMRHAATPWAPPTAGRSV